MERTNSGDLHYFAAIAFLDGMLGRGLINDDDYCALETKYAAKFMPSFRHEKPCKIATFPIRQSEQEGR